MKKNKFVTQFILILFSLNILVYGQAARKEAGQEKNKDQESVQKEDRSVFKGFLEDEKEIWTAPFRMKKKDILPWASALLITGVLIADDESIYRRSKRYREKHEWVDWLSPKITNLGNGEVALGVMGLFYLGGLAFKDAKAKETARLSLISLLHSAIVVQALKHLFGRRRPEAMDGEDHWSGPSGFFKRYSKGFRYYDAFPSGHSITVWSVFTVIAEMYKKPVIVPIVCYSLATLAGLSRITEDKHWLSDVFVGSLMGFAIAKFIVRKRKSNFNIVPITQYKTWGISINIVF